MDKDKLLKAAVALMAEKSAWFDLFNAADNVLYGDRNYPVQSNDEMEALRQAFLKVSNPEVDGWDLLTSALRD